MNMNSLLSLQTRARAAVHHYWPWFALATIPFLSAGLTLINKKALGDGMDYHVFCFYRNVLAFLVLIPIVLYYERTAWQHVTWKVALQLVMLALLEPVLDQQFVYAGLDKMPASFSSSIGLLQPVVTFGFSWIFRLEQVNIYARPSQAKVLGALIAIVGAIIIIVSPGNVLIPLPWTTSRAQPVGHLRENVVVGVVFCLVAISSASGYTIVLTRTLSHFPNPWTTTTCTCLLGALINFIVAQTFGGGDGSRWIIIADMSLVAYLYSGIVVSAGATYLVSIAIGLLGPVVVAAITPLSMVIVTIVATVVFAEQLYLVRMLASLFLVAGMSLIVWGKHRERQTTQEQPPHPSNV